MTTAVPSSPTERPSHSMATPDRGESGAGSVSSPDVKRWWAAYAVLPSGLARDVTFAVSGGRFVAVTPDTVAGNATTLPGVVLPGLANAHSPTFHPALRGPPPDAPATSRT